GGGLDRAAPPAGLRRVLTPRRRASVAFLVLFAASAPLIADVVRLKNGGTIAADSIEERGDEIVVRQGKSRIVVPKADVASIDKSAPRPAPSTTSTAPGAPGPGTAPADPAQDAQRLADLRRRAQTPGPGQAENRRQLVELLDRLAEAAVQQ